MLLGVVLAVITIAVVAAVVLPLLKGSAPPPERRRYDSAVYRDQLRELARDEARGLVTAHDAAGARLEIERRLLAADAAREAAPAATASSPRLAVALALLLPAAAALLYLGLGAPGVPDQPFAAREDERAAKAASGRSDAAQRAALERRVKEAPEDGAAWLALAQLETAAGDWQKAEAAFRQALRLDSAGADVAAQYGEMLVAAAEGVVTPDARNLLAQALARDPANKGARYYLGLAEAQAGNAAGAIAAWQKLAAEEPADSPIRADLAERIAAVARGAGLPAPPLAAPAPGPSAEQTAAAERMSPEERQKMIRGMVDGLAQKLAANPDDAEGWLRLGRAYGVLGERDKAVDAYDRAARLKPGDAGILVAEAEALLPEHRRPETPLPDRALLLLKRAEALDPRQPAALWYLGLAAVQQRDFAAATGYWQRLLAVLPPEAPQHRAVAEAIEAIKGK
jgi:cytochrome c-type biogenesis protein CcmH